MYSVEIHVQGLHRTTNKKSVLSNMRNFFCFNSNVSNCYDNDVIIYKIEKKSRENSFIC